MRFHLFLESECKSPCRNWVQGTKAGISAAHFQLAYWDLLRDLNRRCYQLPPARLLFAAKPLWKPSTHLWYLGPCVLSLLEASIPGKWTARQGLTHLRGSLIQKHCWMFSNIKASSLIILGLNSNTTSWIQTIVSYPSII